MARLAGMRLRERWGGWGGSRSRPRAQARLRLGEGVSIVRGESDADVEAWLTSAGSCSRTSRRGRSRSSVGGTTPEQLYAARRSSAACWSGSGLARALGRRRAAGSSRRACSRRRGAGCRHRAARAARRTRGARVDRAGRTSTTRARERSPSGSASRRSTGRSSRSARLAAPVARPASPRSRRESRWSTIAERPDLLEATYPLAQQGWADFATAEPVTISREDFVREEATLPGGLVRRAGRTARSSASRASALGDRRGVAEDGLTVVRPRLRRRRGLARALKALRARVGGRERLSARWSPGRSAATRACAR